MASRPSKRQRYSALKNLLVNDLQKLTVESGDFNNDLMMANEDFIVLFKSIEDRQSVLLTRSLFLEEKIGELTNIVKDGKVSEFGETSSSTEELPRTYSGDTRRFVEDSSTSLMNHAKMYKELVDEVDKIFKKYIEVWEKKVKDFREHGDAVKDASFKLATLLSDYNRNI